MTDFQFLFKPQSFILLFEGPVGSGMVDLFALLKIRLPNVAVVSLSLIEVQSFSPDLESDDYASQEWLSSLAAEVGLIWMQLLMIHGSDIFMEHSALDGFDGQIVSWASVYNYEIYRVLILPDLATCLENNRRDVEQGKGSYKKVDVTDSYTYYLDRKVRGNVDYLHIVTDIESQMERLVLTLSGLSSTL